MQNRLNLNIRTLPKLLALIFCCAMLSSLNAMAQPASIAVGSASGLPGATVTVPIGFTPGATAVSTLQFDITFSSSLVYGLTTTGAAATAAAKGASAAPILGGVRVLVFGMNTNAIGSGVVASIQFTISSNASAGTPPINIGGIVASDPNAVSVSTTGAAGSIQILPALDTTAPVISSVTSSGVTGSAATIIWTTNEAADTQVDYGTSTGYGSSTNLNTTLTTSHSQGLTGLTANTTYHYRVKSKDAAGNPATSGDYTFTTTATPDTTPPVISGVSSSSISSSSATITWTTDEVADTQVDYGTSTSYGSSSTLNATLTTSHSQGLAALTANTTYHYRVKSKDTAGNPATSGDFTFTTTATPDTTPPAISGVSSSNATSNGVTITWVTNEAADTQVDYGTSAGYGSSTTLNATLTTSHSQGLTGLAANTLYHYRVKSKDAAGNPATSGDYAFTTTTAPDTTPPMISGVSSSGVTNTAATISWTTDEAADTQIEYGKTSGYGKKTNPKQALTTSHSDNLTGLTPNTLYHYQVKSKDAAGNLAASSDYTFTTTSAPDTTAPIISGVSTSSVNTSSATISWATNELSDTQVEYGIGASYGSSTTLNSALAVSHSQILTGLSTNTIYHYRAKSKDAAGNIAVSNDYTFTTAKSGTAPVISAITISNITYKSAVISWNTDKDSDSVVEYWVAGDQPSIASLSELGTAHSLTLSRLRRMTQYQFRLKSTDAQGNQAVTPNFTFTTSSSGGTSLALPRFASISNTQQSTQTGEDSMFGLAVANLGSDTATLTITAVDAMGSLIAGPDIENPKTLTLNSKSQFAILDMQIFGNGFTTSNSNGWIKLDSTSPDVSGFFLDFTSSLNEMDGTNFADTPVKDFAFTEIEPSGSTRINIANGNPAEASVTFNLIKADGTVRSSQTRTIPANGAIVADLYGDLFQGIDTDAGDYVWMKSTQAVLPFELMQKEAGDISSLTGQDTTVGSTILYSPQYVVGGPWETDLSIVNLDSRTGMVMLRFYGGDGVQLGDTQAVAIPANGKLHIDDPNFFISADPDNFTAGYVEVVSDGIRLTGSTVFGASNGESFCAALPLISKLQNSVLFSHVASDDLYYTGIAALNPNKAEDANITIELYGADGSKIDSTAVTIPAKQRMAKLLTELIPSIAGKKLDSGYIKLISDKPIVSFSLFGTLNLAVLSALPPQEIQ